MDVRHEPDQNRFATTTDAGTAVLEYAMRGDAIAFVHTLVPGGARGEGVGSALAEAGMEFARGEGLKVIPDCPFITDYIRDHPEVQDLVASSG